MDLLAILRRSGGVDALARQIDLPPATASAGAAALLPALLEVLRGHAQRFGGGRTGVDAMLAMLDEMGDGKLAAEVMGPGPLSVDSGEATIARLFDSPAAAQRLADDVALVCGQQAGILERILPLLTMLVCGYISARAQTDRAKGGTLDWLYELLMLADDDPCANSGTHG